MRLSSVVEKWEELCTQHKLIGDRNRVLENLLVGVEELTALLEQHEKTFAEGDMISANVDSLASLRDTLKVRAIV